MLGFSVTASRAASSPRFRALRLVLTALCCASLFCVGALAPTPVHAQTGQDATRADLASGELPLRATFDDGAGQIWLAPQSSGRRVGTSFVLDQGAALWSHPTASASLGAPGADLAVQRGGLVALSSGNGTVEVDVFVGRGTATLGGSPHTLEPGTRYSIAGGTVQTSQAPALPAGDWGALPWEPLVGDSSRFPGGFIGVVQVAVEGQSEPLLLDPSSVRIEAQVDELTARLHATLRFDLGDEVPCCNDQLGVFQALLPRGALLHGTSIRIGNETFDSTLERRDPTADGEPIALGPMIEPRDRARGTIARLPFGLWPLNQTSESIEVELEWTQAMHVTRDGGLLLVPRASAARPLELASLELEVTTTGNDAIVASAPRLGEPQQHVATYRGTDVDLETGLSILVAAPDDAPRVWAGRTAGLDGVYFAIEHPLPAVHVADQPTDYLVLIDGTAALGPARAAHARQVALGIVGGLVDPRRDRVQVARMAHEPSVLTAGFQTPDASLLDALDAELMVPGRGVSTVNDALAWASQRATGHDEARNLQIVFIGDARPTNIGGEALETTLDTLDDADAGLLLIDIVRDDAPELDTLARTWAVPVLTVVPEQPATLTVASAQEAFGLGIERQSILAPSDRAVTLPTEFAAETRLAVGPRLVVGRYQSPGPLFDLPGSVSICMLTSGASGSCASGDNQLEADLRIARPARGLGIVHTARALREQRHVAADAEALAQLGLAGPEHRIVIPELQAAFDLEFLARRGNGAPELRWLRRDAGVSDSNAGRAAYSTRRISLPEVSSATPEFVRATLQPLGRDPWLQSPPRIDPRPPTMAEVLSGQRTTTTPTSTGTTVNEPTPGTVAYAIWNAQISTDYAVSYSRTLALQELRSDPVKAEKFLVAWHDVGRRSTNQLYSLQNEYYTLGLQDRATLAMYDIQMLEPWAGEVQRKDAIRYFVDRKHWQRAEDALRTGFERNPSDEFYAESLVRVFESTGRKAEIGKIEGEALVRRLSQEPDRRAVIEQHLERLVRNGHTSIARDALERWSKRVGESPTVYGFLARLETLAGAPDRALALLRKGQEQFPDSRHALAMLLDGLVDAGRSDEALELARQWLARDPHNAHLTLLVGDMLSRQALYSDALDTYAHLIELAPHMPLGYVKVGDALVAQGRAREARAAFEHAAALSPGDFAANMRLIDASSATGDIESAVKAFETVRAAGAFSSADSDTMRAGEELYYQMLLRWRAEATWAGDDRKLDEINAKLRQIYVDMGLFAYNQASPSYALRISFVPETTSPDVLVDMRVTEPGGNIVSYITPYNTALGSQLYSMTGRSGHGPRTYFLPSSTEGTFEVEIGHGGPADHGPLRGQLFVHQLPSSFKEYWSRHDVVLEQSGDSWRVTVVIAEPSRGDAVAPLP